MPELDFEVHAKYGMTGETIIDHLTTRQYGGLPKLNRSTPFEQV